MSGGVGAGKAGSGSGGRVITSSSSGGIIRSTGSGSGTSRERISVCKQAVMKMSAAGKGRSKESAKDVSGECVRMSEEEFPLGGSRVMFGCHCYLFIFGPQVQILVSRGG